MANQTHTQPKPRDEKVEYHGQPVEAVASSKEITGESLLGSTEQAAPGPFGQSVQQQPKPALASEQAAQSAIDEGQAEFRTREEARKKNLAEQTRIGKDVNPDLARAEAERKVDLERQRRQMKRQPGIYVRSAVMLLNEAGVGMECPPGMRLPDEMLKNVPDLEQLCASGVLDDLR